MQRRALHATLAIAALFLLAPVLLLGAAMSVFSGASAQACGAAGLAGETEAPAAGAGGAVAGLYARPLLLVPGRWYEVGATEYGSPHEPSAYGSIPDPAQSYLPDHPDTYAELSVLASNPADHGTFTFNDANALGELPYMTGLRVAHDGREMVLYKRDVGYGQGPGQTIPNGEPYRLDIWWQAARQLHVSKSPVRIQLAPQSGTASTLGQLPPAETASGAGEACEAEQAGTRAPLPLTPGTLTQILPDGRAAAGRSAPRAVKLMVAAGNRLYGTAYQYGAGHGSSLDTLQSAYDCSSAVSYLLHAAGLLGPTALDSTELESYGAPGPGAYVSIYTNPEHAFIYISGLRFDTVETPAYDTGPNSGKPGPRWRVYPSIPGWATWTVRHPPGL